MTNFLSLRQNGYYQRENNTLRSSPSPILLKKLLVVFSMRNVVYVVFLCIYTLFVLLLRGGFPCEEAQIRHRGRSVIIRDINDVYDVGCNGYSMDYRIEEQRRILRSVRSELIESSEKLREVNMIYEGLTKTIPEKQLELNSLLDEIESAKRALRELQDRRNVRVFLPHSFLYPPDTISDGHNRSHLRNLHSSPLSSSINLENSIDYSHCSITSFMPLFLTMYSETTVHMEGFRRELLQQGNIVMDSNLACLVVILTNRSFNNSYLMSLNGTRNHVIINFGKPFYIRNSSATMVQQTHSSLIRSTDYGLFLDVPDRNISSWNELPPLLPFSRTYLMLIVITAKLEEFFPFLSADLSRLTISALSSGDKVQVLNCSSHGFDSESCISQREKYMRDSTFCVVFNTKNFSRLFWESLRFGCIPVVASMDIILPFQGNLDWRLASVRIALARFPEIHFILRSFDMPEVLEMRRMGRVFFERYLGESCRYTREYWIYQVPGVFFVIVRALLASLRERLGLPSPPENVVTATPLFNNTYTAPILTPVNLQPFDDEYLGPIEAPFDSPAFLHNFSSLSMYSYRFWNVVGLSGRAPEFIPYSVDHPTESEFYPDSNIGFRPIEPGSGIEFSKALGGNRVREQFTVVLLTYNRDSVLSASLERLHRLPYLNKVIVIWNNVAREPLGAWPRLHVPVEFIKVSNNSLNNRFVPWDRIRTEAILSLDDDIDLKQHEIVFAFRVWRENRHRIVGFPARHHARYGDQMYYNSNHTCQLSIILTGAAFLHKSYLHAYTHEMPEAIRRHVDEVTNCEDIAMNFLVAHITREAPIKTTSKWTLKCPTCSEMLSQDETHFLERHDCIRFFTKVYGYNPLKFSQFRADSILFKTRLPPDKQKCFRFV
ncbi:hypothetical protein KIN20_024084 [Parelaphostrongylus tenuis]|uniref:Uncharacterized protein n=1 Tax=Parelaphostrongylus tenuis TaxID=148309 RepID=A0AAD5QWH7_PARTN|nr:hypothetical protein KIN20_024084 [Parelaphostrongylus tenuis]